MSDAAFCVCVLLSGSDEYAAIAAKRLLNTEFKTLVSQSNTEVRFITDPNNTQTQKLLQAFIADIKAANAQIVLKDTAMFYGAPALHAAMAGISAPFTLVFGTEAYLTPGLDVEAWRTRIERQLASSDIAGSVHTHKLDASADCHDWIKAQPWFTGHQIGPYVKHPTAHWWAAKTTTVDFFTQSFVPLMPALTVLGAIIQQKNLKFCHFCDGVILTNAQAI